MTTPKDIFEKQIAGRLADPAQAEAARELDAVYQFHVTGPNGGDWYIDLRQGAVGSGNAASADCTITIADDDFVGLVKGEVPGPALFMQGKLEIAGDMGLAMRLSQVLS